VGTGMPNCWKTPSGRDGRIFRVRDGRPCRQCPIIGRNCDDRPRSRTPWRIAANRRPRRLVNELRKGGNRDIWASGEQRLLFRAAAIDTSGTRPAPAPLPAWGSMASRSGSTGRRKQSLCDGHPKPSRQRQARSEGHRRDEGRLCGLKLFLNGNPAS
jgi:hypothetical protein